MRGKYKISGRLLVLPISGEGDNEMIMYGLKIKARLRPTYQVKDGKTYLKISNYQLHVDADK